MATVTMTNGRKTRMPSWQDAPVPGTAWLECDGLRLVGAIVCVDPGTAAEWLALNEGNRRIRRLAVDRYATAMQAGEWRLNGEPIIFGDDGKLKNGQHRLEACIKAGTSFYTLVVWGVTDDAYPTMDRPALRQASDVLAAVGESRATTLSPAIQAVHDILAGVRTKGKSLEPYERLAFLEQHPGLRECVDRAPDGGVLTRHVYAACYYLCSQKDPELAQLFFEQVHNGLNLCETDPAFLLRRVLINQATKRTTGSHLRGTIVAGLTIKAWNLVRTGKTVKNLILRDDEPYPTVL